MHYNTRIFKDSHFVRGSCVSRFPVSQFHASWAVGWRDFTYELLYPWSTFHSLWLLIFFPRSDLILADLLPFDLDQDRLSSLVQHHTHDICTCEAGEQDRAKQPSKGCELLLLWHTDRQRNRLFHDHYNRMHDIRSSFHPSHPPRSSIAPLPAA